MESWRYAAEGKGFMFPDEIDLSIDSFGRNRKLWEGDSVESMEFVDLGFSPKKSFYNCERGLEMMLGSVELGIDPNKIELASSPSFMMASNSSMESGSNHSNSLMEANSHDSSLIDLKLGRLTDGKNALNSKFFKERSVISSVKPSSQAKRARTVNSRLQTPFCQVYGCHKDLSSLKDYHKRHKVCEVHSKTPKVIVNGIEQRFCQQCSRFHLLVEFDEGKRSCRKRLAGHNERRRKPQFGGLSGRSHRLLHSNHSYLGTKFLESSLPKKASIIFPNILPSSILYSDKYEQANNFSRPVKLEEKSIYCADGQLLPKSFLHLHGNEIQNTSGMFSPASEDFTLLNATSSIHNLSGVPHSSCALSLLSTESQDLSQGIIMARPFDTQPNRSFGIESSGKYISNGFHSTDMDNSIKLNHNGSFMVSCGGDLQVETDGFIHDQETDFLNSKYCVNGEDGSTVDLLQLSSHLHRVEQQRNSTQVKHEIEDFSRFLPTYGT